MRWRLRRWWKWLAIFAVAALPGLVLLGFVGQDLAIDASFKAISPNDTEEQLTARFGKPAVNTWDTPDGTYKTLKWKRITWDKRERLISVDLLPSGKFLHKGLYGDSTFVKKWTELIRRFAKELL